jgi:hypothetical protein
VKALFHICTNEEKAEKQCHGLEILKVLEQLEKEIQILNYEKKKLLDAEKVLMFMIKQKVEAKVRKNRKLRSEVEKQRAKCTELARILNASILQSYSIT